MVKKDTTELLKKLRELMQDTSHVPNKLEAFVVFSEDAHGSEYTSECDKHRIFISGFTGSAGEAVITLKEALMWTDARYYLQAVEEMDQNWTLMKSIQPETPTIGEWLLNNLPSKAFVGILPENISHATVESIQNKIKSKDINLLYMEKNLIDILWLDRPPKQTNPILPHPLKYSGRIASEKLCEIRKAMEKKDSKLVVLSKLDEIAWTLNLRGSDVLYSPVFFSYLLIYEEFIVLFINKKLESSELNEHLENEVGKDGYKIAPYEKFYDALKCASKGIEGKIWIDNDVNHKLFVSIPSDKVHIEMVPVAKMKEVKNKVEIEGMRSAQIKDSTALCCFYAWLESSAGKCKALTELRAEDVLEKFRNEQKDYVGPSFRTISAVGLHAALPHYFSTPESDVPVTKDDVFLVDAGAQFKEGTTDITRTVHFGTPSELEKKYFTLVLKGNLEVVTSVFPPKTAAHTLDSFARRYLWQEGLDFGHATGHGIGSYLNVHEGPTVMNPSCKEIFELGQISSNEPGYYEFGKFGFRIEDVLLCVPADTPYHYIHPTYYTFENLVLIPYQQSLMAVELLSQQEIDYLNKYNKKCRDVIGPILEKMGKKEAKEWLWKETEPISNCNLK